jgi:NADH dehydrogenase/NADH:ubiquinone oxidoreductase subunit G
MKNDIIELKEKLNENQTRIEEMDKNIVEKEYNIKNKVGEITDLKHFNKEICTLIEKIENDYTKTEKATIKISKEYDEINNKIILSQNNLFNLNERNIKEEKILKDMLYNYGFKSTYEVEKFFMDKSEIEKLNKEIQEYRTSLSKIKGALENIYKNMNGKTLTKEQWVKTQNDKDKKSYELKKLYDDKITLDKEVISINTKLLELKDLLNKKESIEHKLGLLNDLEKLFKGKKFVEFVASNQLQYISLEADKKLKETFKKLEFLGVFDIFNTETAKEAEVVIPIGSSYESSGSFTRSDRRIQKVNPGIKPRIGESNLELFMDWADKLNIEYRDLEDIREDISHTIPEYSQLLSLEDQNRIYWSDKSVSKGLLYDNGFATEDKKAHLFSGKDGKMYREKKVYDTIDINLEEYAEREGIR